MKTKGIPGMEVGPQKNFDTSGKSPAHFQHPPICWPPASDALPMPRNIADFVPSHPATGVITNSGMASCSRTVRFLLI